MATNLNDFRSLVFIQHPNIVFLPTTFILSTLSFSPQPSFLPIVLCLALVKTFARIIIRRPNALIRSFALWFAISSGVALAHLIPSLDALSTTGTSLSVLSIFSALTSFIALSAVILDAWISARVRPLSSFGEITLFPLIWAAVWYTSSLANPVGRLFSWTPLNGAQGYKWLAPYAGPVAIDWIVAGWAVLGYRAVGAWFIGESAPEVTEEDDQLIDHPVPEHVVSAPAAPTSSGIKACFILAAILTLLALPSIATNDLPLPTFSPKITPFTVACVLPVPGKTPLSLGDYITETKKLNSANLLLWPEGAVQFTSEEERNHAFNAIARALPGHHIGVGFEEPDPDSHGGRSRKRTGLALVYQSGSSSPEVKMLYYKRHLVPIAESFSFTPSHDPPPVYTIDLHAPRGVRKPDWAPYPNNTRPIPVTTSICLDFSHPSVFSTLETRPALILAPARTWHTSIGVAMWEQAKARAEEIRSMVLWCDGGEGGVSGIAGMGINEITRVGAGSWTRAVGLPWPFDGERTMYARGGDFWALVLVAFIPASGRIGMQKGFFSMMTKVVGLMNRMKEKVWRVRGEEGAESV